MIVAAAILFEGQVYSVPSPARHHHVIKLMGDKGVIVVGTKPLVDETQGFLTDTGAFVDRIEGAKHALESGQIAKLNWPPRLFSEDLW